MGTAAIILRWATGASFVFLTACAGLQDFAGGCRTVYVLSGGAIQPMNTCGGVPREGLTSGLAVRAPGTDLAALLAAPKFGSDAYYTGVDTQADRAPLTKIVNDAVRDLIALPAPRNPSVVRERLARAVEAVAGFATEDREHAYMYLVLAWRAAGNASESRLFARPDEDVIAAS